MIEDVSKWTAETTARIQAVFDAANLGDHPLATNLCIGSVVLARAMLRDDLPGGFVVVSSYLGMRLNPLLQSNPERYNTIMNETLIALAINPDTGAYRCADLAVAVLFDLGGYAAVRIHGDALRKAVGESL